MKSERILNSLITAYSYTVSSVRQKPLIYGMPPAISCELTNHCNLRCPECPSGSGKMKRERGYMDPELFRSLMKELKPYLFNSNLYFQGEPMLHPQFFSFLTESADIRTTVSTNGHFLSEENSLAIARSGLSRLIISLDGIDQDTYSAYRINGKVENVTGGIRNISEARKRQGSGLIIVVQMLVNRYNEKQIPEIRKFADELKVRLVLKSMQIYGKESIGRWLPSESKFSRYRMKDGEYLIKSSLPGRCARLWFNPVVTWDGKLVPCCFDKDAEYVMGDLTKQTFREIWHGQKLKDFRKQVLSHREKVDICRNCTTGLYPQVRTFIPSIRNYFK